MSLLSRELRVGRVARRVRGTRIADTSSERNRFRQASLFIRCERVSSEVINRSPSVDKCEGPASTSSRDVAGAPMRFSITRSDTRSCALVSSLFTFWPPGPELRAKENCKAAGGTHIPGAISIPDLLVGMSDSGMVDRQWVLILAAENRLTPMEPQIKR